MVSSLRANQRNDFQANYKTTQDDKVNEYPRVREFAGVVPWTSPRTTRTKTELQRWKPQYMSKESRVKNSQLTSYFLMDTYNRAQKFNRQKVIQIDCKQVPATASESQLKRNNTFVNNRQEHNNFDIKNHYYNKCNDKVPNMKVPNSLEDSKVSDRKTERQLKAKNKKIIICKRQPKALNTLSAQEVLLHTKNRAKEHPYML